MESNTLSVPLDNAYSKASFRKPSNDAANRKYRRRSPVSGSSSSDASPKRQPSSSPVHSREDPVRDYDPRRKKNENMDSERDSGRNYHGRGGDPNRLSDRQSARSSHYYHRREDYDRHEKNTDEEERNNSKSSSRSGRDSRVGSQSDHTRRESGHYRSRDHSRGDDKYYRDRYDGSRSRAGGKERDSSSLEYQKYKDRDSVFDRADSGKRRMKSNVEDVKPGERDRHKGEGDGRDEKRDCRRSSGDYRSDRSPKYEESRGHRNDTSSRRDSAGHGVKEASKSEPRELDSQKYTKEEKKRDHDWENSKHKDLHQEYAAKKPKLFSLSSDYGEDVSKLTTVADEKQSSSSKQTKELLAKVTPEQTSTRGSEIASDIDAAKVAAMKAAELVNRNLVGTGYMSTDQKKKLLWGNKKNTSAQESGHNWDAALFSDREQQEKFNKLMSLRLPWCLWQIVGCEGRCESGAQTQQPRKQWPPSREAEGSTARFGEAIHCWTSAKRWSYCWAWPLRLYVACFCNCMVLLSSTILYSCASILAFEIIDLLWFVRGDIILPSLFEILIGYDENCTCI